MHALPRERGSWSAQSVGSLEGWDITVNDLVLAPDPARVRLPVAQLGCGHLRVLRSPERLDSQWPKESRAMGRHTRPGSLRDHSCLYLFILGWAPKCRDSVQVSP